MAVTTSQKTYDLEMGSGASADNARATVTTLLSGKPADASDIKVRCRNSILFWTLIVFQDLEQARNEIRNLRRIAKEFQNQLRGSLMF